jgi:hypothetical protein
LIDKGVVNSEHLAPVDCRVRPQACRPRRQAGIDEILAVLAGAVGEG